jgi:hypothetical protein
MINNIQVSPYSFDDYDPYYKQLIIVGYYLQYLVRYYGWEYKKLPLNGLSSVIFDGYSPTYCVASGNIWFDHPIVSFAACYTPKQIDKFHLRDLKKPTKLDWKEYEKNNRMCLRLNPSLYNEVLSKYPSLKKYVRKGVMNSNETNISDKWVSTNYDENEESFQQNEIEDASKSGNSREKIIDEQIVTVDERPRPVKRQGKSQYSSLFQPAF